MRNYLGSGNKKMDTTTEQADVVMNTVTPGLQQTLAAMDTQQVPYALQGALMGQQGSLASGLPPNNTGADVSYPLRPPDVLEYSQRRRLHLALSQQSSAGYGKTVVFLRPSLKVLCVQAQRGQRKGAVICNRKAEDDIRWTVWMLSFFLFLPSCHSSFSCVIYWSETSAFFVCPFGNACCLHAHGAQLDGYDRG